MLLWALWAGVFAADDFRVELCRFPVTVDIETSAPLFGVESRLTFDSCGSGIPGESTDDKTGELISRLIIATDDGKRFRVVLEDGRRNLRVEKDDIALDQPAILESPKTGRKLRARVFIRDVTVKNERVSLHIVNQPIGAIAERLRVVSGWKQEGAELLGNRRASFRFDAMPMRAMLMLIADVAGVDVATDARGDTVFSPRKPSP